MTTNAVPSTDPADLVLNAGIFDTVVNGTAQTFTDRLGNVKPSVLGAIESLKAFNSRGAWVTGSIYAVKDLVSNGGTWYACVTTHTASALFATDAASKWRVHQGATVSDLDASKVVYTPAGVGSVSTYVQATLRESVSVCGFLSAAQIADGVAGTTTLDCTAGVQAAINHCLANNVDLSVPYLFKISQVMVDRLVDLPTNEFYFTIYSENGGGFYTSTATPMFSSSLAFTEVPVSHLVRWHKIKFVGSNISTASYVIDAKKFLRIQFNDCSFYNIKFGSITGAGQYYQSYALNNCFAQGWSGSFMKADLAGATDGAYDVQVIGGLYQAGGGQHCFDMERVNSGKFWTTIVNCVGTAIKINGPKGVDISCYLETNGLDIDFRTGGIPAVGVNIHGCIFLVSNPSVYTVVWGEAFGCTSHGNIHFGSFHNLQANSAVSINDHAYTSISTSSDAVANDGYRELSWTSANLRSPTSAAYTTTAIGGKYTKSGNQVILHFEATLTSTGTNPASPLWINAGLPKTNAPLSSLCGHIEVVGSSQNNGISPLYVSGTNPIQVTSSIPVIPANISGNSWLVRGYIVYIGTN